MPGGVKIEVYPLITSCLLSCDKFKVYNF